MNRFEKQLAFSVIVIYENIELHKQVWEKLIEKDDGYLKPSLKAKLTRCMNILEEIYKSYEGTKIYEKDFNRYKDDLFAFSEMKNYKMKHEKSFDFKKEENLLPEHFLDSITSAITAFEYCTDKLTKTLKEKDCYKVFEKAQNSLESYAKFLTDEVILYV